MAKVQGRSVEIATGDETRIGSYNRGRLISILTYHRLHPANSETNCACGWSGPCHVEHIADVYENEYGKTYTEA